MICGVNLNEAISPLLTNGVENNAGSPEKTICPRRQEPFGNSAGDSHCVL
jgi:hypothetical protein